MIFVMIWLLKVMLRLATVTALDQWLCDKACESKVTISYRNGVRSTPDICDIVCKWFQEEPICCCEMEYMFCVCFVQELRMELRLFVCV